MEKRMVAVLALLALVAFGAFARGQKEGRTTAAGRPVLEYSTFHTIAGGYGTESIKRPSLKEQEIEKRFGIRFQFEEMPESGAMEKMNVLFATGQGPDVIVGSAFEADLKRWGLEGHLLPLSDYLDRLPDYLKMYKPETWAYVRASAQSSDGKLYWLPSHGEQITGYSWNWRKGTMDRMKLSFPRTLDELYTTLKAVKTAVPDAVPIPNRSGVTNLVGGFALAFRTAPRILIDDDTGDVVFGPATDKMRKALIYMNKLYANGIIEPEFATATSSLWQERYVKGLAYMEYTYFTRVSWANQNMAKVDPEANWDWSRTNVVEKAGAKEMVSRWGYGPYYKSGGAINASLSKEKVDRMLEYFNWSLTEEGQIFQSFGVEGITFHYRNGKPVFADNMYAVNNPKGTSMADFGFSPPQGSGFLHGRLDYFAQLYGSIMEDLIRVMDPKPYIKDQVAWKLTVDQERTLADCETVMDDLWKEYGTKFVMGKLDPSNDGQWAEYQTALKKAGIEKALEIRRAALKISSVY